MTDLILSVLGGLFGDLQTILLLIAGVVAGVFGITSNRARKRNQKLQRELDHEKAVNKAHERNNKLREGIRDADGPIDPDDARDFLRSGDARRFPVRPD